MSFDHDDSPPRLRQGDVEGAKMLYGARPAGAVALASDIGGAAR